MSLRASGVLGIKTAEGTIAPILDFRAQRRSRTVFTTIADRQERASFEFYSKDRGSTRWTYLDSLLLERIPPAKAGKPNLRVEANVDASGSISVDLSVQPENLPRKLSPALRILAPVLAALFVVMVLLFAWKRSTAGKASALEHSAPTMAQSDAAPQKVRSAENSAAASVQDEPAADEADWYQIRWGDTLWRISESHYGERRLFGEIAEQNQLPDPDDIIAGEKLYLPPAVLGKKRER